MSLIRPAPLGAQTARPGAVDPLLTVNQLAEREGMTPDRVRYLIKARGLPAHKAGGVRIRWSEYLAWLDANRRRSSR